MLTSDPTQKYAALFFPCLRAVIHNYSQQKDSIFTSIHTGNAAIFISEKL